MKLSGSVVRCKPSVTEPPSSMCNGFLGSRSAQESAREKATWKCLNTLRGKLCIPGDSADTAPVICRSTRISTLTGRSAPKQKLLPATRRSHLLRSYISIHAQIESQMSHETPLTLSNRVSLKPMKKATKKPIRPYELAKASDLQSGKSLLARALMRR